METTLFALREKSSGKLLSFFIDSNEEADFCNSTSTELDTNGSNVWEAKTAEQAEYVRNFSTPWYNSDMETPKHNFEADELEVVKIERKETIEPVSVKIPTVKEFIELRYRKTDPAHADYLQTQNVESYSFYDLKEIKYHG